MNTFKCTRFFILPFASLANIRVFLNEKLLLFEKNRSGNSRGKYDSAVLPLSFVPLGTVGW